MVWKYQDPMVCYHFPNSHFGAIPKFQTNPNFKITKPKILSPSNSNHTDFTLIFQHGRYLCNKWGMFIAFHCRVMQQFWSFISYKYLQPHLWNVLSPWKPMQLVHGYNCRWVGEKQPPVQISRGRTDPSTRCLPSNEAAMQRFGEVVIKVCIFHPLSNDCTYTIHIYIY